MKKLCCLFPMLILSSVSARSQTSVYHPFPTGNASWVYEYYDDFHMPTGQFKTYSLNGDTTIASVNYKKLYMQFSYAGAVREDNKIIYFIPDTSSTEVLLYDFNLSVGDTLIHPYGGAVCAYDTAIVVQVDSVLASDGYHRQLWFNSFSLWIEGIGALNYLLNPCNVWCVSGNDVLICMSTDSGFTYPAGISSCFASIPENQTLDDLVIVSPNPFHQNTDIELGNKFKNSTIFVYTTSGMLVSTDVISNTATYLLHRNNLTNGMYFLLFVNEEGVVARKKIVID